jgi:uncharacterized protein YgiB involved in biofilm formation
MFSLYQITKLTLITIATVGFLVMLSGCEKKNTTEICYNGEEAQCLLVE